MLSWVVVGVGDITVKRVIPAIREHPRSRLAGIVTRMPAKAKPYEVPSWRTLREALNSSNAEAIYVATPVALHAPQTIEALRAGRHVLCEKPMAMTYAEACSMQLAAETVCRVLGVAYYRRTYPKVLRAKELLAQGVIGLPFLAELNCQNWVQPALENPDWRFDPLLAGGGPLFDIASHRIDLLNDFFGTPARACGQRSNLVHRTAVEDNATVLIEYASGVRGIVDVRWHSRVSRDEFRIRGTEGEIELSPLNGPELVYPGGREALPPHSNIHYPCVANFVDAVLDGEPLRASGASSLWTDWITEQAIS